VDVSIAKAVLITAAAAFWLIGGNVVLARYYRQRGTSLWQEWEPFKIPWEAIAATWRQLLALAVASLTCAFAALLL